jgi:hypothetical protein
MRARGGSSPSGSNELTDAIVPADPESGLTQRTAWRRAGIEKLRDRRDKLLRRGRLSLKDAVGHS